MCTLRFEVQKKLRTTEIKEDKHARLTSVMGQIKHRWARRDAVNSKMKRRRSQLQECSSISNRRQRRHQRSRTLGPRPWNKGEEDRGLASTPAPPPLAQGPCSGWLCRGETGESPERILQQLMAGLSAHLKDWNSKRRRMGAMPEDRLLKGCMPRVFAAQHMLNSDTPPGGSARTDARGERAWRGGRRPPRVAGVSLGLAM